MKYSKVYIESLGYELAPVVVTSAELESRLEPLYKTLHFAPGQLQALTGIRERRWWEPGFPLSKGAVAAGKKALAAIALRTLLVYPPCAAGGKARAARQGGFPPGQKTPLLHYVQLPPYFIGGIGLAPREGEILNLMTVYPERG